MTLSGNLLPPDHNASLENTLSLAPAFAIFLGLSAVIAANSQQISPAASICIAMLTVCAWVLFSTERAAAGWIPVFILLLLSTLVFSLVTLYRFNKSTEIPSYISSEAKVLLNREWGRRRALLFATPYGRVVSYAGVEQAPSEGSKVRLRGAVFNFDKAKTAGFNEFLFWRAKGAVKKVVLFECEQIKKPGGIYNWRGFLERRIRDALPERSAACLLALTTGVRTKELAELHRNSGTVHLLAVSGFHVGILFWLTSRFFRRGLFKTFGVSAALWLYIVLSGSSPGGVRAALMLQVYLLSLPLGRTSCAFNNVSFAGVLMLLYNPWSFFDVGWQMSLIAALFLTAAGKTSRRSWYHAASVSFLVWLVTAPIAASAFNEIPLAGLFINAVAVPLFAIIFHLVLLFALPALTGIPFGWHIALAAEYILLAWEKFSQTAVCLFPWGVVYTRPLLALSVFIFSIAVMNACGFSKTKTAAGSVILPAALILLQAI